MIYCSLDVFPQTNTISGFISDSISGDKLVGVNVIYDKNKGTVTDSRGYFELKQSSSNIMLEIRYIGYKTRHIKVVNQQMPLKILMQPDTRVLEEVVVSASKYQQNRKDVSVSMEVVGTDFIENNLELSVESVLEKAPGLNMIDGQASIRGGSGYSYGAGSRVLLLVDGMPLMTGASGEAKWDFVPAENIKQIEIIKGASSVLYGSSALNGVVNIRTQTVGIKPKTSITARYGFYGNPPRKETQWSDKMQTLYSLSAAHSRKIGALDLSANLFAANDNGYKKDENEQFYRFGISSVYHIKRKNEMKAGVRVNAMHKTGSIFLLWRDADSGIYVPGGDYIQNFTINRLHIDPFFEFLDASGGYHKFQGRYYTISNQNNTGQNNQDFASYAEYQYQKKFKNEWNLNTGLTSNVLKSTSQLYGNREHKGINSSIYLQLDKRYKRLSWSMGARGEANALDGSKPELKPVIRSGINYSINEASSIRMSFGQGYRYPSVAEKFTFTQVGSLNVFPNQDLKSESGWSAELGWYQGYQIKKLKGVFDVAFFQTGYNNMIEFMFDYHFPTYTDPIYYTHVDTFSKYIGFKAYNIGQTQISGIDMSLAGKTDNDKINVNYLISYQYVRPKYLNFDTNEVRGTTNENILKYRSVHTLKVDINLTYKKLGLGANLNYWSNIENIDRAFVDELRTPPTKIFPNGIPTGIFILPGLDTYRMEHNKGDAVLNLRLSCKLSKSQTLMVLANNVLNREYMIRPGDIRAPRNFHVQYILKF